MFSENKIVQVVCIRCTGGGGNVQLMIDLRYPIEAEPEAITLDLKLRVIVRYKRCNRLSFLFIPAKYI